VLQHDAMNAALVHDPFCSRVQLSYLATGSQQPTALLQTEETLSSAVRSNSCLHLGDPVRHTAHFNRKMFTDGDAPGREMALGYDSALPQICLSCVFLFLPHGC
jgi:hypothetical protein